MLYKNFTNSNPYAYLAGQLVKLDCATLPDIPIVDEATICPFECCYKEYVFAKAGGESYENDKASFLFTKLISTDTILIELENPSGTDIIINNNTYGIYYSTFTAQPNYVGFILDFQKCLALQGVGTYRLKVTKTILGAITTWHSQYFYLLPYSEEVAHGTIRIEWYQTGNILSSEFNYENLISGGWYQSMRIKGTLGKKKPKLTIDNYLDENYKIRQNQEKIINEYELTTNMLPRTISDILIYDGILGNKLIITNNNIYSEEFLIQKELYCNEIIDKKSYYKNKNSIFILKFSEQYEKIIKTNF